MLVRLAALRGFAVVPAVAFFAGERFAGDLRAVDDLVAPVLADFARVVRDAVDRFAVDLRAVERVALDFRAGVEAVLDPEEVEADPSMDHLPVITRCAASATASAMIEPSLVALDTTLVAA